MGPKQNKAPNFLSCPSDTLNNLPCVLCTNLSYLAVMLAIALTESTEIALMKVVAVGACVMTG